MLRSRSPRDIRPAQQISRNRCQLWQPSLQDNRQYNRRVDMPSQFPVIPPPIIIFPYLQHKSVLYSDIHHENWDVINDPVKHLAFLIQRYWSGRVLARQRTAAVICDVCRHAGSRWLPLTPADWGVTPPIKRSERSSANSPRKAVIRHMIRSKGYKTYKNVL